MEQEEEKEKINEVGRREMNQGEEKGSGERETTAHTRGKLWPHHCSSLHGSDSRGHRNSLQGTRHSSLPHNSRYSDYMNLQVGYFIYPIDWIRLSLCVHLPNSGIEVGSSTVNERKVSQYIWQAIKPIMKGKKGFPRWDSNP